MRVVPPNNWKGASMLVAALALMGIAFVIVIIAAIIRLGLACQ
jgi:hypothetical protein